MRKQGDRIRERKRMKLENPLPVIFLPKYPQHAAVKLDQTWSYQLHCCLSCGSNGLKYLSCYLLPIRQNLSRRLIWMTEDGLDPRHLNTCSHTQ